MYFNRKTVVPKLVTFLVATAATFPLAAEYQEIPDSLDQVKYDAHIKEFLAEYCWDCHDEETQKADLNLAKYEDEPRMYEERRLWEAVRDMLETREMPPEKKPQPSEADRKQMVLFVEKELAKFDCNGPVNPGRVTIRRLNRAEYNNTIRDLTGIDFDPTKEFPLDEVGYGFDNIGDVLSLPPMLLEKYLAASERIVTAAIVTDSTTLIPSKAYEGSKFTPGSTEDAVRLEDGNVLGFWREGSAKGTIEFPLEGNYTLRFHTYGDQAGSEPPKLELKLNDAVLDVLEVRATERDARNYDVSVSVDAGSQDLQMAYLNNFNSNGDRNVFVKSVEIIGPIGGPDLEFPASHRKIIPRQPKPTEEAGFATEFLEQFASRAFRRPATENEVSRLTQIYELARREEGSFEQGMQLAAQAVLVSPQFLFRWELDPSTVEGLPRQLNDHELASRLSYFLWSSMPDEQLTSLATRNILHKPEVLEEQVQRMIQDKKSWSLVENFAGQWLQIRSFDISPDPDLFPDFDEPLRRALQLETMHFFGAVMKEDLSIMDLLDADFTFANERLARHYGVKGVRGDAFGRITLPPESGRGGILTQGSILALSSNPTRTSPVNRGKWIMEQILGTPPPPPPPNVPLLEENKGVDVNASLRTRMEQHRANPDCATCHEKMDPLGFAFENFDAIGAWRDKDGEHDIDASGKMPDGVTFNGPAELKQLLMRGDKFARTVTEKMLTFALGRGLEYYDKCTVDEIVAELIETDYKFSTLVLEIVKSQPFQMRQTAGDDS